MKSFSLLIKPASADCNLHCAYCFYRDRSGLYPETARHRMSDEVLERLIAGYMATEQPHYTFGWQGGEPTLMGIDFFRRAIELQVKYALKRSEAGKKTSIANGLQTNAVLIDDEFARHLADYRFLLGVSIDGPAEIHDHYRVNSGGHGSHGDVLAAIERLRRSKVELNALVLVNSLSAGKAKLIFDYLLHELGIAYHQYIPCVEFDAEGRPLPWTIGPQQWGDFLCELYDAWQADGSCSIRFFDCLLERMTLGTSPICHMGTNCCQYFVVEYNGDVYPCDFFVDADKKLGNVADATWEQLQQSPAYVEFGARKTEWNIRCDECEYAKLCAGDCLKHRTYSGNSPRNLSWLCEGWKQFYRHAMPGIEDQAGGMVEAMRRSLGLSDGGDAGKRIITPSAGSHTVGRNDPCPCGSGKKFKKCCGK